MHGLKQHIRVMQSFFGNDQTRIRESAVGANVLSELVLRALQLPRAQANQETLFNCLGLSF